MRDPLRLFDESSDELERALLRAGRSYRATASARERTLAALGVAGSATLLGKVASAVGTSWGLKTALTAAGLATAVGAGVYLAESQPEPALPDTSVSVLRRLPAERAPASETSETQPVPLVPSASASVPAEPAPPAPTGLREGSAVTGASTGAPPGPASISAELRALDAARSALASGNGAEALRLLDVHARTFPRGRLKLEAEVLRIEALDRTGDTAGAAARARAFLARHPKSVFAPRVERFAQK